MTCQIHFYPTHPNAMLPTKATGDLGWDIYCVDDDLFEIDSYDRMYKILLPQTLHIFHTGLKASITPGYSVLLWDRSGLAAKYQIHRLAGVIDNSYRGEWMVCLINLGHEPYTVFSGDRIVQGVVTKEIITNVQWGKLKPSRRGDKGFGSSGR